MLSAIEIFTDHDRSWFASRLQVNHDSGIVARKVDDVLLDEVPHALRAATEFRELEGDAL